MQGNEHQADSPGTRSGQRSGASAPSPSRTVWVHPPSTPSSLARTQGRPSQEGKAGHTFQDAGPFLAGQGSSSNTLPKEENPPQKLEVLLKSLQVRLRAPDGSDLQQTQRALESPRQGPERSKQVKASAPSSQLSSGPRGTAAPGIPQEGGEGHQNSQTCREQRERVGGPHKGGRERPTLKPISTTAGTSQMRQSVATPTPEAPGGRAADLVRIGQWRSHHFSPSCYIRKISAFRPQIGRILLRGSIAKEHWLRERMPTLKPRQQLS